MSISDEFRRIMDPRRAPPVLKATSARASRPYAKTLVMLVAALLLENRILKGAISAGDLTVPGENHAFQFSVNSPGVFLLDSIRGGEQLQWILSSYGTVLGTNRLSGLATTVALPLNPADYQLKVAASGDWTGSYAFSMHRLDSSPVLNLEQPISLNLTPGLTTAFLVKVQSGDLVLFKPDPKDDPNSASVRLINPAGRVAFVSDRWQAFEAPVQGSGAFGLLIEGRGSNAPVSFVTSVRPGQPPIAPEGKRIEVGEAESVVLAPASRTNLLFAIPPSADQRFEPALVMGAGAHLQDQFGVVPLSPLAFILTVRSMAPAYSCLLRSGPHQLQIDSKDLPEWSAPWPFPAQVLPLSHSKRVTFDQVFSYTNNLAEGFQLVSFDAQGGERVFVEHVDIPGDIAVHTEMRLLDPLGTELKLENAGQGMGPIQLPGAGRHTLAIRCNFHPEGDGFVAKLRIVKLTDVTMSLQLGEKTGATISQPGQVIRHQFTLDQPTGIYFDVVQAPPTWHATLRSERNGLSRELGSNFGDGSVWGGIGTFGTLPPDNYTLECRSLPATATTTYRFRILDVATVPDIGSGAPVEATASEPGEAAVFQFQGEPSSRWFYDFLSGDETGPAGLVVDPGGRQLASSDSVLFSNPTFEGSLYPQRRGRHLIVFPRLGNAQEPSTLTFALRPGGDFTNALPIGSEIRGTISVPEQSHHYQFEIPETAPYLFEAIFTDRAMSSTLTLPRKGSAAGPFVSEFDTRLPLRFLEAGQHGLTITQSRSAVGSGQSNYVFRITPLAQAAASLPFGGSVEGVLVPQGRCKAWQFTADAGQAVRISQTGAASANYASWALLGPDGRYYAKLPLRNNAATLTVPLSGTWTVLLFGSWKEPSLPSYRFSLESLGNKPLPAITGDLFTPETLVHGNVPFTGRTNHHRFVLTQTSEVGLTSSSSPAVRLRLFGKQGEITPHPDLAVFNSVTLPPGSYEVQAYRISSNGSGDYRFYLTDYGAAPLVNLDQDIQFLLQPHPVLNSFEFMGEKGQSLLLTVTRNQPAIPNRAPKARISLVVDNFMALNFEEQVATGTWIAKVPFTPDSSGRFRLQLFGDQLDPSQLMTFRISQADLGPVKVKLNETMIRPPPQGMPEREYVVELQEPHRVAFDRMVNDGAGWWGFIGNWESFPPCCTRHSYVFAPLSAGTYRLDRVSDMFRILDLEQAPPIAVDGSFEGELSPTIMRAFSFEATLGEELFMDSLLSQEMLGEITVGGPDGRMVTGAQLFTDIPAFRAPLTGRYFVILSPTDLPGDTTPFRYRLHRIPPVKSQPLVVDTNSPLFSLAAEHVGGKKLLKLIASGGQYLLERSSNLESWTLVTQFDASLTNQFTLPDAATVEFFRARPVTE